MGQASAEDVSRIAWDVENHLRVHRGVPIPLEELRSLIRGSVSFLLENEDQSFAASSCGDTLVVIYRYKMENKTWMQAHVCEIREYGRIEIGQA